MWPFKVTSLRRYNWIKHLIFLYTNLHVLKWMLYAGNVVFALRHLKYITSYKNIFSTLHTGDHGDSFDDVCPVWWEWMGEPTQLLSCSLPWQRRTVCEARCLHAFLCRFVSWGNTSCSLCINWQINLHTLQQVSELVPEKVWPRWSSSSFSPASCSTLDSPLLQEFQRTYSIWLHACA